MAQQEQERTLWQKIINSRLLAGVGVVALFLAGGATLSKLAEAQAPAYSAYTAATGTFTNELNSLQQQISSLHNRVSTLETQMREVQNRPRPSALTPPTVTAPNFVTPTYPIIQPVLTNTNTVAARPVVIDQNGGTYIAGFDIYFTGRGFTPNETIFITRNGALVGQAIADTSGNFSANGVFLPFGPTTFVFTGQTSSVSAVASVRGGSN